MCVRLRANSKTVAVPFFKFLWKKVDCSYFSADGSLERTFCDFCHNLSVIVCVSL